MGFKKGYDPRRKGFDKIDRAKAQVTLNENRERKIKHGDWEELSIEYKKRRILLEQNNGCLDCGISTWRGLPLSLELDHVDGNIMNNSRENLRVLCPNCHSQTPTFRKRKSALLFGPVVE